MATVNMLIGRKHEREMILRELAMPGSSPDVKRIISIYGEQGVGTSALASSIRNESVDARLADVVMHIDTSEDCCSLDTGLFSALIDSAVFTGDVSRKDRCTEVRERCEALTRANAKGDTAFSRANELTEALFVDLLQSLYPFYEDDHQLQPEPAAPKKIIIIIDRHSSREEEIDSWLLDDLLLYSYIKSFADIRHYSSPYVKADTPVRRFLDVRFVIAGKTKPSAKHNKKWENWKPAMLAVPLHVFGKRELKEVLQEASSVDVDIRTVEQCFSETGGHPALVSSWLLRTEGDPTRDPKSDGHASRDWSYFTTSLSSELLAFARIAAACDRVDETVLRCFIHSDNARRSAMQFFRHHWAFAECPPPHADSVFILEQARMRLMDLPAPEGERSMDDLRAVYATHTRLMDALPDVSPDHLHRLRALACARRFDAHLVPDALVPGSMEVWEQVFTEHRSLFEQHEHTVSLRRNIRQLLNTNTAFCSPHELKDWTSKVHEVWNKRYDELQRLRVEEDEALHRDRRLFEQTERDIEAAAADVKRIEDDVKDVADSISRLSPQTPSAVVNKDALPAIASGIALTLLVTAWLFTSGLMPVVEMELSLRESLLRMNIVFIVIFGVLTAVFSLRSFALRKERSVQARNIIRMKSLRESRSEMERSLQEARDLVRQQKTARARRLEDIRQRETALSRISEMCAEEYMDDLQSNRTT